MKVSALGAVPFVIPHDRNLQLLALCVPGCVGSLRPYLSFSVIVVEDAFIYEKTNICSK